jgi:hypothetical protein
MLTDKEKLRIQEGTFVERRHMSEQEVVLATLFGGHFKVAAVTLSERDSNGMQWIELCGWGENGLADFDEAMRTWNQQSRNV